MKISKKFSVPLGSACPLLSTSPGTDGQSCSCDPAALGCPHPPTHTPATRHKCGLQLQCGRQVPVTQPPCLRLGAPAHPHAARLQATSRSPCTWCPPPPPPLARCQGHPPPSPAVSLPFWPPVVSSVTAFQSLQELLACSVTSTSLGTVSGPFRLETFFFL